MKYGSGSHDLNDIFSYAPDLHQGNNEGENKQVTLSITNQLEDRRGNTVQFDLAYVKVDEQKVLTAFDNASTTTLILRDLVKEGKIELHHTTNTSKVKGIGGSANVEVVEVVLHTRKKARSIIVTAAIVDEIMNFPTKEGDRLKQITQLSVEALNKKRKYGTVMENNFKC